ncbi:ABC transporter substrate-binding protein [Breznakiella homolactica]|uniref:Extracellular solute-binding protein n=1 Tax=Breznakiella homolactica TaxID=2798577 RepID=A0A7T7XRL3_9SPIR|nr:extracellular solute-binding protein [Breznakiella homolactica]QQO11154.1 extracellular solute-binding protein [Breznakiella homolactica]
MKRLLLCMVVLLLAAGLFAGGQPDGGSSGSGQKPVTIRVIKIDDPLEAMAFRDIVNEFHQIENGKYAHVNVEFDIKPFAELFPSITKAVATKADIDIAMVDGPNVRHFAFNNVIRDLTEYFSPEELKTWAPQSVEEGSYAGRFYGPPLAQSAQLLWYNVDMMNEAGIDVSNTAGWKLGPNGEALRNFQKLTVDRNGDGTPEVFALNTDGPWDYFYGLTNRSAGRKGSNTYKAVADDGITFVGYFDTPEAIAAFQFQQDLVYKYKVKSAQTITNQMFTGLSATHFYQDMIIGTQKDMFPDFKMGAIEPTYWETPICHTGSWHYGILTTSPHFEEALAFVKFAASDAGAKYIWKYKNQFPANVNLYNSIDEFVDPASPRHLMVEYFQKAGVMRIATPAYTEYNTLFTEFWQSLMAGERDVPALTRKYAAEMQKAAQPYKGWNSR